MEIIDRDTPKERIRFHELVIGFAGCAGDHVHSNARMGHCAFDVRYAFSIECRVVATAHALQDHITAALQGYMEMRHELLAGCYEVDDLITAQIRFDAADAETLDAFHLVQRLDQSHEVLALAVSGVEGSTTEITCVHAGEYDLLDAGLRNALGYSDSLSDGSTSTTPPCEWNGAEGTEIVAAVLHFQECARSRARRSCSRGGISAVPRGDEGL